MADTTRETADHAELKRLAEAATHKSWAAFTDDSGGRPHTNLVSVDPITDCALSIPGAHKNDPNVAFIASANPARVLALLSEIAALRGERERDNAELLALIDRWEDRATQAERQRDELRKAGEAFLAEHDKANRGLIAQGMPKACAADSPALASLRQALANQGADQ